MPINLVGENITFKQCKFGRERYADSIINLIENSDNLTENNSFVFALDSAWGTGKSTFVRMLLNKIKDNNIDVVLYNAWENDYCQDALTPLLYDILNSDIFKKEIDSDNMNTLAKTISKLPKAIVKDMVQKVVGSNVMDVVTEGIDNIESFLDESFSFKQIKDERDSVKKFREIIRQTTNINEGKKLLIVIDELDRCKPTFAISTLEILKHLFDIPGIYFLLSIDLTQLHHSVSTIYGVNMDSEGYLRRFINFIIKLPEPSVKTYISFYSRGIHYFQMKQIFHLIKLKELCIQ